MVLPVMARIKHKAAVQEILLSSALLLTTFSLLPNLAAAVAGIDQGLAGYAKRIPYTGIVIPGFASTRLRAWGYLDCPLRPIRFHPLDNVWLDTGKVLSSPDCWLQCMTLDPRNQTDNPLCKSRPDWGLPSISELDPGYITGPLSSVWREFIEWSVEFGLDPKAIIAVPYDWRLTPFHLEERDLFFHELKQKIENAVKLRKAPTVVFAHSMGNNVFRYFMEWLRHAVTEAEYQPWIDTHIHSLYAVAGPLLGSTEAVKALFTGLTFGLPITEGVARQLSTSVGASTWLLPFSRHCSSVPSFNNSLGRASPVECSEQEKKVASSGWPLDILKFVPPLPGTQAYPTMAGYGEASKTFQKKQYTPAEVAAGQAFKDQLNFDPYMETALHILESYYLNDSIVNPLTTWERPPIKNVYCTYGIDLKTEVSYTYAPSGKAFPENWVLVDEVFETEGGNLVSSSGSHVSGNNQYHASGDVTVPYHSLSYCKEWLGPKVNITRAPQASHDSSDVQVQLNVKHVSGSDIKPNMKRKGSEKYVTYYEDSESRPGMKTAVWELDKVDHRAIVQNPVLLRELWLEMLHEASENTTYPFVSKHERQPIRDADCFWDYARARCALPDQCEYRYTFGDVHLTQSCRLKIGINESAFIDTLM